MELPVQITFRNLAHSEEVESFVREKATRLDSFYDRITSCRVMVELPHQRHRSSNLHHIRIELTVLGGELAISRKGTLQTAQNQAVRVSKAEKAHTSDKNLYVAIRVAFEAARRQLQDYARRQRGKVRLQGGKLRQ